MTSGWDISIVCVACFYRLLASWELGIDRSEWYCEHFRKFRSISFLCPVRFDSIMILSSIWQVSIVHLVRESPPIS
jgi:hypothetical protein